MSAEQVGKRIVIIIIILMLAISMISTINTFLVILNYGDVSTANYKLFQGIVRLILTALLCFFMYKGHRWAKWVTVVLYGLAIIASLAYVVMGVISVLIVIMTLIDAVSLGLILLNNNVNIFLNRNR